MFKSTLRSAARKLKALDADERGADMVEYILIIAAVGLPLLAFIIYFYKDVREWAKELYEDIKGEASEPIP